MSDTPRTAYLLLALTLQTACSTTIVSKVQKVTVETSPPGAAVYVSEGGVRRSLGTTPLTVDQPYEVRRHESSGLCWVPTLLSGGLLVYGLKTLMESPSGSGDEVLGIVGTELGAIGLIGGVVGCGISAAYDGEETPTGEFGTDLATKRLYVGMKGYELQTVDVPMPGPDKKLSLSLPALDPDAPREMFAAPRLPPAAPGLPPAAPMPMDAAPANLEQAALLAARDALNAHLGRPGAAGNASFTFTPPTAAPPVATLPAATPPAGTLVAGAPQPTAFALVIGVERYRDLPAPSGARADAERFATLAKRTLGVPERNVLLSLDDRATKGDLEKQLRWLEKNVPNGGRIYLFFAGHGAPDPANGTSYLLPYDADPSDLAGTALPLSEVTTRLGKTKARDVVAFLDSCFSGTGGRSVIAAGTRPLVPVQRLTAPARVSILAAVTGAQISGAAPGSGAGLFSHYLLEGLGNARADIDGDGQISLKELHEWVYPRVEREAKRDSRDQVPSLTPGAGMDAAETFLAIGVSAG